MVSTIDMPLAGHDRLAFEVSDAVVSPTAGAHRSDSGAV